MMRFFTAHVHNGRLLPDEPTDLPDGTHLELVSADDVENNGGDLLDAEERTEISHPTRRLRHLLPSSANSWKRHSPTKRPAS